MSSSHGVLACFRHSAGKDAHRPAAVSGKPNLTTCFYQTHLGLFSLTWSRTLLGHSLNLCFHSQDCYFHSSPLSLSWNHLSLSSIFTFNLDVKPFPLGRKHSSRTIPTNHNSSRIRIFWDLTRVKFGSGLEPRSGFYIAVVFNGEIGLLVGDLVKEAYARTRAEKQRPLQALVLRRESVFGNRMFCTRAKVGGKNRDISVDCTVDEDARLCFSFDNKRVLQIKRLKWKFRGNERTEVDGAPIQISWDVHNWLFKNKSNDGHAVFMFKFENRALEDGEEEKLSSEEREREESEEDKNDVVLWQQSRFGISGIKEWRKTRRSILRSARSSSSSSISMSSASSGCSSSVMEWASSADEAELSGGGGGSGGGHGFSLLVYAWMK